MPQLEARKLIDKWTAQYPTVGSITWSGYEDLGASTLGVTRYDQSVPRISLHAKLLTHPIWGYVVLWHEYCHAAAYYEYGTVQAHGRAWRSWLWKKPILAIIDALAPAPSML